MSFAARMMCCSILFVGAVSAQRPPVTEYVGRIGWAQKDSATTTRFHIAPIDPNGMDVPYGGVLVTIDAEELSNWRFYVRHPMNGGWVSVNYGYVEKNLDCNYAKYRVLFKDYVVTRELYLSTDQNAFR